MDAIGTIGEPNWSYKVSKILSDIQNEFHVVGQSSVNIKDAVSNFRSFEGNKYWSEYFDQVRAIEDLAKAVHTHWEVEGDDFDKDAASKLANDLATLIVIERAATYVKVVGKECVTLEVALAKFEADKQAKTVNRRNQKSTRPQEPASQ